MIGGGFCHEILIQRKVMGKLVDFPKVINAKHTINFHWSKKVIAVHSVCLYYCI